MSLYFAFLDIDGRQATFLCPNGTQFSQAVLVSPIQMYSIIYNVNNINRFVVRVVIGFNFIWLLRSVFEVKFLMVFGCILFFLILEFKDNSP